MEEKAFEQWLSKIKTRDPRLYDLIAAKLKKSKAEFNASSFALESTGGEPLALPQFALETIVMETGRPAIPIKDNKVSYQDAYIDRDSAELIDRLKAHHNVIEPIIPLVGRIDVSNFQGSADYVGTGWQIEPNVILTNRHVAQLIAERDGQKFAFRPGRFGDPMDVSVDYFHELSSSRGDVAAVTEIIWIEENIQKADIAFLKSANTDGWLKQGPRSFLSNKDRRSAGLRLCPKLYQRQLNPNYHRALWRRA